MLNQFILLTTPAATGTTATGGGGSQMLLLIGEIAFLGVVLYFLMIRPQRKRQKEMNAMLSTVAIGDSVLTSGGMYGVVIDVMEDTIIVEFGNNKNCRIPMKKSAIVELEKAKAGKE